MATDGGRARQALELVDGRREPGFELAARCIWVVKSWGKMGGGTIP